MIVADASVVVESLRQSGSPAGAAFDRRLAGGDTICAPHLLDAEVGQALRGHVLRGEMHPARALAALDVLARLPIRRFAHQDLLARAFELRSNVTIYDGLYLALAETLDVTLLSCDAALRDVPGCAARVEFAPVGPR